MVSLFGFGKSKKTETSYSGASYRFNMNDAGYNVVQETSSTSRQSNIMSVDDLQPFGYAGQQHLAPWESSIYDGEKFFGGFGVTQIQNIDYWTLRARSAQLFNDNLYARGLIRRLITNEINTGLTPEMCPDEKIIGLEEDSLNDWSEDIEARFAIWAKNPELCDYKQKSTFGALQRMIRMEALISGDVLVVLRQSKRTKLPMIQLVNGGKIRTPFTDSSKIRNGNKIKHGIEFDSRNREVAYWAQQEDGDFKRIPARGEKSGRKIAWLVFGTEKRLDDVRGQPLLSLMLQSLKEIDRYRDSAQRKAVINSIIAGFIKKTTDKPGTLPISGGAVRKGSAVTTDSDGGQRSYNIAQHIPGLFIEELQEGEEPVMKGGEGTDVNFGVFEEVIVQSLAWANEIPPEILRLAFSNNYSASQAAINEFKIYLNKIWCDFGESVCDPIKEEWLLSEVLLQKISAPGLLEAWRDPTKYDVYGAWTASDWYGSIKPSTDMFKQTKGSEMLVNHGWSTNAREARITTGTKFTKNIKRIKRENELLAEAMRPIEEFKQEFGNNSSGNDETDTEAFDQNQIEALIDEYLDDCGVAVND